MEKAFLRRLVLRFARGGGHTAPLFAGAGCAGDGEARRGQLGTSGLGLCFSPQLCFDQCQVVLELHQDLVLRRSQSTGLDKPTEGGRRVKRKSVGGVAGNMWGQHALISSATTQ